MRGRIGVMVAAAVAALAVAAPLRAQEPRDPGAQQNVRQSEQYEKLLCTNAAFRKTRIDKECGPITDPSLHQQCIDSFNCDKAPVVHPRQAPPSERIQ